MNNDPTVWINLQQVLKLLQTGMVIIDTPTTSTTVYLQFIDRVAGEQLAKDYIWEKGA